MCVGTNDLNKCHGNGVLYLKSPLKQLCKKIKLLFPDAKVYFQPVLPMPVKHKYTVRNIRRFNKLLYDTCIRERFYFIDIFWDFVGYDGLRYKEYYPKDIHPNKHGIAALAKHYIYMIHSKRFNPLGIKIYIINGEPKGPGAWVKQLCETYSTKIHKISTD